MSFVNISSYKFVPLTNLPALRAELLSLCQSLTFKGTIILSPEGINIALAGTNEAVDGLSDYFAHHRQLSTITFKKSFSDKQPFRRLRIKIKNEIIRLNMPNIQPEKHTVKHLPAPTFKQWLDSNKDMIVLDTRNDYELRVGTFHNAVKLDIESFTQFPQAAADALANQPKDKPVVMFCTGGVRCEKAGPALEQQGFREVYQLEGGILKYFELCGGEHWEGECFVFDDRVAVDTNLRLSDKGYCPNCAMPLPEPYRHLPHYLRVKHCKDCIAKKPQVPLNETPIASNS